MPVCVAWLVMIHDWFGLTDIAQAPLAINLAVLGAVASAVALNVPCTALFILWDTASMEDSFGGKGWWCCWSGPFHCCLHQDNCSWRASDSACMASCVTFCQDHAGQDRTMSMLQHLHPYVLLCVQGGWRHRLPSRYTVISGVSIF